MDRVRLKARQFLTGHKNHIAMLKLRRNEPLAQVDLLELKKMFVAVGVDQSDIAQVRAGDGFGLFVRSLVGLERDAAKKAFEGFLADKSPSANQIEFLNMGSIIQPTGMPRTRDCSMRIRLPTSIDPMGIAELFGQSEIDQVVSVLEDVRRRAAA
jgi:type I restriction enzyme R subunit